MGLEQQKILRKWRSMTLKEEYQHKIDMVNKILKKEFKTNEKAKQDYERMRDIYQYRIDAINRLEKAKEDKLKQELEKQDSTKYSQ